MAGRYADICAIAPWGERSFQQSKEIVLETARKHSRENRISFASILFAFGTKYDRKLWESKVFDANRAGCEYFITGFPRETYEESMNDFAKNVISSFEAQRTL